MATKPAEKKQDAAAVQRAKTKEVDGLFIKSVPKSFRRCGHRFDRTGHGIALDCLTEEQIKTLEAEPNLKVERCTFPVPVNE